jgi:hypothetical protein
LSGSGGTCFSLSSRATLAPGSLFVGQAILPVRMGLRPIKGDENLAEVQLSRTSFDALTAGRVNGKSEAFDRAGGLSGRLLDARRISSAFPFQWRRRQRNAFLQVDLRSTGQAEACPTKRRRQECRRCRHECPRHVPGNGVLARMAEAERRAELAEGWLDRMWGRMASGGRLVIGPCEFSYPLVAPSAMLLGSITFPTSLLGKLKHAPQGTS